MLLKGALLFAAVIVRSSSAFVSESSITPLIRDQKTSLNAKKILLAFDGTGNNARDFAPDEATDRSLTNVLKLHLLAGGDINNRRNDIDGQISIYERGIGAVSDNKLISTLRQVGGDLSRQTKPMREKLEAVYEPGDKLYLVGFSRGAASARKFATLLYKDGLKTKDGELVEEPPIEFVGCFETVAMQVKRRLVKILRRRKSETLTPSTVLGEDGRVAPNVSKAVHCVALNDNRQWDPLPCFPPVLMGAEERVHEAWFAGEHGDVGGNFYTKGIPDCACVYMKEWMESLGEDSLNFIKAEDINDECLKIDEYPEVKITATDLTLTPDPTDRIHLNAEAQIATDEFTPSYRPVLVVKNDEKVEGATVNVHESVLLHMEAMKEKGTPYLPNPYLKDANPVVVGPLGVVSDDMTERLKAMLG